MGHRSNIRAQDRGFYYAASGDDNFDGRSLEVPKKTIQAAIDGAVALSPPPSTSATAFVREAQGGLYVENLVLGDSVLFEGTQTTIVSTGAVGVQAASFMSFRPQTLVNNTLGATCLELDGVVSFGANLAAMFVGGDSGTGFDIQGACDNLFFSTNQIDLRGDGCTAVKVTGSSSAPIDFNFNSCAFSNDNSTFLEYSPSSVTTSADLNISSLFDMGGATPIYTGTSGLVVNSGVLKARAGSIQAETVCNVAAGAILSLSADAVEGAVISAGNVVFDTVGVVSGDISTSGAGVVQVRGSNIIGSVTTVGTGGASIKCDQLVGDITIGAGTAAYLVIDAHIGTLTNNGTINGIINGVRYGNWRFRRELESVLSASSNVTQQPSSVDTPIQVEFGAAQPGTPVDLDVLGNMTIQESGQYEFTFTFQYGRSGSGGISWLFFRLLKNGTQVGTSPFTKLENLNADFPAEFNNTLDLVASDVIAVELYRDSRGNNSGGLIAETPLLGGWSASPSASVEVKRSKLQ